MRNSIKGEVIGVPAVSWKRDTPHIFHLMDDSRQLIQALCLIIFQLNQYDPNIPFSQILEVKAPKMVISDLPDAGNAITMTELEKGEGGSLVIKADIGVPSGPADIVLLILDVDIRSVEETILQAHK